VNKRVKAPEGDATVSSKETSQALNRLTLISAAFNLDRVPG
jgi:hypothetical protein